MTSAFGVEHVSKLAVKVPPGAVMTRSGNMVKRPKGKLKRLKVEAVNTTTKLGTAGPTPAGVALRSFTPLRAAAGH